MSCVGQHHPFSVPTLFCNSGCSFLLEEGKTKVRSNQDDQTKGKYNIKTFSTNHNSGTPILFDAAHMVEVGANIESNPTNGQIESAIDEVTIYAYALTAPQIAGALSGG